MSVKEFVRAIFGDGAAKKLKRIGTGGQSNQKGSTFENFYAVAKICMLAANSSSMQEMDDYLVSSQEEAFVDDLCVRQTSTRHKTNYQAKNSAGAVADWDAEMQLRFERQQKIDIEYHECSSSQQVLLVSCADKAAANDQKIPSQLKEFCASEYFFYSSSSYEVVKRKPELRDALSLICTSNNPSILDSAFKLVLGIWSEGGGRPRSIGDLVGQAKAIANPNIFAGHIAARQAIPGWLLEKCAAFLGCQARVEFGSFIVSYNGMEVSLGTDSNEPEARVLEALQTPSDFLMFLLSKSADGLKARAQTKGANDEH